MRPVRTLMIATLAVLALVAGSCSDGDDISRDEFIDQMRTAAEESGFDDFSEANNALVDELFGCVYDEIDDTSILTGGDTTDDPEINRAMQACVGDLTPSIDE